MLCRSVIDGSNPDAVAKIVSALNIKVAPRDIRSKDSRNLLNVIMQQWLPLSTATFQAIVDVIPPPNAAQAIRVPHMLHPEKSVASTAPLAPTNDLEKSLYACDQSSDSQVVGYVSKMFAVRRSELPQFKPKEITAEEMRQRGREERERRAAALAAGEEESAFKPIPIDEVTRGVAEVAIAPVEPVEESPEVLLGFSRIFSGVLRRDTAFWATLPKYDSDLPPTHPRNEKHVVKVQIRDLYMMMGRELIAVEQVPAGHVCAIAGLEGVVFRNGTLWAGSALGAQEMPETLINLAGVDMQAAPIVRVALEPENPSESC